eukprot:1208023-Rhodomonas_salina.1
MALPVTVPTTEAHEGRQGPARTVPSSRIRNLVLTSPVSFLDNMCVENVFHRAASEAVSHQRSQHDWCSPLSNKKLAPLSVRRCSSINSIVIGSGCNSVVFKCTDAKTGETFAVKEPRSPTSKDACRSPQGQKDSRMLQDLRHENVVEHRRGCEDGSMVLEYLDGGSLLSVMERAGGCLDEEQ